MLRIINVHVFNTVNDVWDKEHRNLLFPVDRHVREMLVFVTQVKSEICLLIIRNRAGVVQSV